MQKSPESPDKVSISLFSEIFGISAKFYEISETFGVSTGPPDSLGDLIRENTITFYSEQ
jgi:hypothetical protein